MKTIMDLPEIGPQDILPIIQAIKGKKGILSPLMEVTLQEEINSIPKNKNDNPWTIFFPEGLLKLTDSTIDSIRKKRTVTIDKLNPNPITDLSKEFLITSNVLIDMPSDCSKIANSELAKKLQTIKGKSKQRYFYDHPIPMDTPCKNNEIIYGLKNLNTAVKFEKENGIFPKDQKLTCVLSLTTTYDELSSLAKDYVKETLNQTEEFSHLTIYAFSEDDCKRIIEEVLKPLSENREEFHFWGVSGEYGRHYSFLKSITALIQATSNSDLKGSFKIDLDQVFDQEKLQKETKRSAFSHFCSPLWGATGHDQKGRTRKLGMIAGSLVNQSDIEQSLFTPDVTMPAHSGKGDTEFFCSQIPQAISTIAEMMPNHNEDFSDDKKEVRTRIHVTGGTNGILVADLRKYRPFTPSFIGRAEDQAYLLSIFDNDYFPLTYLHKPGLVMRHDKEGFATKAIAKAKIGRTIGDYQRILLFSAYAKYLDPTLTFIKEELFPFTGCFVTKYPLLLALLRLVTKVQATKDEVEAKELAQMGIKRIEETLNFVIHQLDQNIEKERAGHQSFYEILDLLEKDEHYKKITASIINECRLS